MSAKQVLRYALVVLALLALVIILGNDRSQLAAAGPVVLSEELREQLAEYGEIPIIITLDVASHQRLQAEGPGSVLDLAEIDRVSRDIVSVTDGVLDRLAVANVSQIKRYDHFPFLAMIVDEAALEALAADQLVIDIALDVPVPPAMDDTLPLIGANNTHFLNYTGRGWSIAILDTGVQKSHPALAGKVISEACYSSNVPSQGASSLCPGGAISSTASNSALNCSSGITGCDHGTHVAGIAARVAPSSWLIPIQVFSRFTDGSGITFCRDANRTSPCTLSYTSDQVKALDRVWQLHVTSSSINVAAANMSLGGGFHTSPCDNLAQYNNLRIAIDQLRSVNVATVIAAGNSGYRNAMAAPACLTSAISVAASDKSNLIASFSNISSLTTLIAPGTPILAPVPTSMTPIYQAKGGTSMAAPHVAGAIATFKEARPNATVPQIVTALTTTGPTITDQRSGGFVTKRRLNTWSTLCALISCDNDDFRTISANQTLNGAISPAGDVDHYYYYGTAGQRLTLRMNRTSGSHDPYLELYSPSGFRVAFNDNGGGGVNALINGYLLPQNGLYQIRGRSVNNLTGNYQISASTQVESLNPVPQISHLSPGWVYGSFFGSDFWVAIYGNNFMPESQVRINGSLRAKYYSSPTLIYIRVLGGDIYWPWPRNAFITVVNPTPGGGTSNSRALPIYDPFLGESKMLHPETGSSGSVGISQTFAISWTVPITIGTWRDMQYMDMRLRNEAGETAAWVRVVEQPGAGSFYRLLNASEEIVGEGLPGEDLTLVLTDTVSLHLAESSFAGSGLTAIMTPTLTFGPAAIGTYNVEFRVDSKSGDGEDPNVQDGDVLGTFTILPEGCEVAVSDVLLSGPDAGLVDELLVLATSLFPLDASLPVTITWTPEPETGQGFPNAAFRFDEAGEHLISVQVENCGAFAAAVQTVRISTGPDPDLSISKVGPATAVAGQPFTYTLTVANSGALTATNLLVRDILPTGATHLSGGILVNDEVQWSLPELGGYGQAITLTLSVSASTHVVNAGISVEADGGHSAQGATPVETRIVDDQVLLTPIITGTLSYTGGGQGSAVMMPGGSVFADTLVAYVETGAPADLGDAPFAGRAFRLEAYQENVLLSDFRLYESVQISLTYDSADVAGLNPERLTLRYREGGRWQDGGVACTTDTGALTVHCTAETPLATQFALVEGAYSIYLPLTLRAFGPPDDYAEITSITLSGSQYVVTFQTVGFTPQLPGQHVHFFFDTVPPLEAGLPGSGPWYVYGGPSPFTGYGTADRPVGATQMCVLVANPDHSVIQGSGNCYALP
jgi:uncharacterized repeat protein (TIGR01451 family)